MMTITKSLVLSSALAAAALVAAFETSPRTAIPPAADHVAQRFPLPSEMFTPVPLTTYVAARFIAAQGAARSPGAASNPCAVLCRYAEGLALPVAGVSRRLM